MKIIVTGGMGFVGYELCKKLHSLGHTVHSIDNMSTNDRDFYDSRMVNDWYSTTSCITQVSKDFFQGADIIFHCAAKARVQDSLKDPNDYLYNNIVGTHRVCLEAMRNDSKFFFISSSSVQSDVELSPYSQSKKISEKIMLFNGFKNNIIRLYNVYGEQMPRRINTTLIGNILNAIDNDRHIELYGDGSKLRDFTHIEDVVDNLVKLIDKDYHNVIELGMGKPEKIIDVIKASGVKYEKKKAKKFESSESRAMTHNHNKFDIKFKHNVIDFLKNYSNGRKK
jgi:nucleoside-diphosphate-sugar epimerase